MFRHPFFLLLVPIVIYLNWRWRRVDKAALRFSDLRLVDTPAGARATLARHGGWVARTVALALLSLALAGPRWADPGTRLSADSVAVALVVDVSASMAERDFSSGLRPISRLEAVQKAFHEFVQGAGLKESWRGQDLMALIIFGTRPETACPLTLDHDALLRILDAQETLVGANEATTNPGDALAWAVIELRKAKVDRRFIIFLTDGESNVTVPAFTPRQAAQLAGNLDIRIYAIGAGPVFTGDPSKSGDTEQAKQTMEDVARITSGMFFQAGDVESLQDACARIDGQERARVTGFVYLRYLEAYPLLALAALGTWLGLLTLQSTWWRRIP